VREHRQGISPGGGAEKILIVLIVLNGY